MSGLTKADHPDFRGAGVYSCKMSALDVVRQNLRLHGRVGVLLGGAVRDAGREAPLFLHPLRRLRWQGAAIV